MQIIIKDDIIKTILSLPPIDRIDIVDKVMLSMYSNNEKNMDNLWAEEAQNRVENYISGNITTIPLKAVFDKVNNL